jgi:hypothetical protein
MALSKINLVRLKSGEAPTDGSLITYDSNTTLYQAQTQTGFLYEVSPYIKLSETDNDANFISLDYVPLNSISVDGTLVGVDNRIADIGPYVLTPNEVSDGAYSQHFISTDTPVEASGKDGDLWFVIA